MSEELIDNTQQKLKSIYMYRKIHGKRVRWLFEVDAQMNIVREGPSDPAELGNIVKRDNTNKPQLPLSPKAAALENHKKALDEKGIKYTVNETGQILLTEVPVKEKQMMQFFDLSKDCPDVVGMESLRNNYKDELAKLGGASCPACQLNTLQRKYRDIMNKTIFNQNGS